MDLESRECLSLIAEASVMLCMRLHVVLMTWQKITVQCKAKRDKYDMACPKQYLLLVDQLSFKS